MSSADDIMLSETMLSFDNMLPDDIMLSVNMLLVVIR
jgi:hypothetical protein